MIVNQSRIPDPSGGGSVKSGGFPKGSKRRETRVRRPLVERLETKALLSGKNVAREFLFTPIPESTPLREHIHVGLTIVIDGRTQTIPEGIGLREEGASPLHTHDASGLIHVESTRVAPFRLRDFFSVWGQDFSRKGVLGHGATSRRGVRMWINGVRSQAFGSLLLRDGEEVRIVA